MSSEEEYTKWLHRSDKTFTENLQFAIKSLKSSEFTLSSKYEIALKWFCDNLRIKYETNSPNLDRTLINEFLEHSFPLGLVTVETKKLVIETWITMEPDRLDSSRNLCEILLLLCAHNSYQDFYKFSYETYCKLIQVLVKNYENHIKSTQQISVTIESKFFTDIIQNLTDFIKRLPAIEDFEKYFTEILLQPLLECFIVLKTKNLRYFDDILEIMKMIYFHDVKRVALENCMDFDVHVNLAYVEFSIAHYHGHLTYFQSLLKLIFGKLQSKEKYKDTDVRLMVIGHVLDLLRKYDVRLNLQMVGNTETSALQFISKNVQEIVNDYCKTHLEYVLKILSSVIKLNPIILEQNVFDILIKCMLIRKTESAHTKYEEFVKLLIEMFRKLSRAEKFVSYLLKSVKEFLKNNKLSKKCKRKLKSISETVVNDENQLVKKLKSETEGESSFIKENFDISNSNEYVQILLSEFQEDSTSGSNKLQPLGQFSSSWSHISFAWPSETVGSIFSKFLSTLMSKPSLVIWKTLAFSLSEIIEHFKTVTSTSNIDENLLFIIDLNSSLLCQYLQGTRLPEQSENYWTEIQQNRQLTHDILRNFGQTILNFEHHNRIMNAFLQICCNLSEFDLISLYYCPDSIRKLKLSDEVLEKMTTAKQFLSYLSGDEWTLIEQRIINFGNYDCKINLNLLYTHKLKAQLLFNTKIIEKLNIKNFLPLSTLSSVDQLKAIFSGNSLASSSSSGTWLLNHLSREEQIQVCELMLTDSSCLQKQEFLQQFVENHEFFEIILINLYKLLANAFKSKKSKLSSINFEELLNFDSSNASDTENDAKLMKIAQQICEKNVKCSIKNYSSEDVEIISKVLVSLPVGFYKLTTKTVVFILNLALYKDLLAVDDKMCLDLCFQFFKDLLHFGQPIAIFSYFTIEDLLTIFPPSNSIEFYKFVFHTFERNVANAELCLSKIIELFSKNALSDDHLRLLVVLIESISHQKSIKALKKYQDELITIFIDHVNKFFANEKESDGGEKRNHENDKKFVLKTIPAYIVYISSHLGKMKATEADIDEDVRRICKMYIAFSMDCSNFHAVKLINVALAHKIELNFYSDEIEFVLQKYWKQLQNAFKDDKVNLETADTVIQLVVSHKSTEEFQRNLMELSGQISSENNIDYVCQMLALMAKCHLSAAKGAIFNEYLKEIIANIVLDLKKENNSNHFQDFSKVLRILDCQQTFCENTKIPISIDHIDDILSFLMDINLKKFSIDDSNVKTFHTLHAAVSGVCLALIKFRHTFLCDRIPQFVYVFKDLLQSLCWYKSDRSKNIEIKDDELYDLEELALKLENLMHLISSHGTEVKRIAPYLLTFTINLMISCQRPITLYSKIKTRFESICFDLIAVCDHRVESFILRCSNDATKQIYESLRKDYQKYKFKGKV